MPHREAYTGGGLVEGLEIRIVKHGVGIQFKPETSHWKMYFELA